MGGTHGRDTWEGHMGGTHGRDTAEAHREGIPGRNTPHLIAFPPRSHPRSLVAMDFRKWTLPRPPDIMQTPFADKSTDLPCYFFRTNLIMAVS